MNNKYFKDDAKQLVDQLFDAKMFKESISRDDMNAIEDLIEFLLQSRFDSYIKIEKINERLKSDN
jgi:hypothetical protein